MSFCSLRIALYFLEMFSHGCLGFSGDRFGSRATVICAWILISSGLRDLGVLCPDRLELFLRLVLECGGWGKELEFLKLFINFLKGLERRLG